MHLKSILFFLLLLNLFAPGKIYPQEIWSGSNVRIRTKDFSGIDLEGQYRFNYPKPEQNFYYYQGSLRKTFLNYFGVVGTYRQTFRKKEVSRITGDVFFNLPNDSHSSSMEFRFRYQRSFKNNEEISHEDKLRFAITSVLFRNKTVTPYFSPELFFNTSNDGNFEMIRFSTGIILKVFYGFSTDLFYKVDFNFDLPNNKFNHILGGMLSYRYKLNFGKERAISSAEFYN